MLKIKLMKYILTLCVLFCLQFLNAQKNQDHSELLKSYTIEELEEIKASSPENYNALIYALDNGIYLGRFDENKHAGLPILEGFDKQKNFTAYGLKIENTNQYFYCPAINRVMVLKSFWWLNNEKSRL
jgi:hypothetical protein